jgi:hypothetical protein
MLPAAISTRFQAAAFKNPLFIGPNKPFIGNPSLFLPANKNPAAGVVVALRKFLFNDIGALK